MRAPTSIEIERTGPGIDPKRESLQCGAAAGGGKFETAFWGSRLRPGSWPIRRAGSLSRCFGSRLLARWPSMVLSRSLDSLLTSCCSLLFDSALLGLGPSSAGPCPVSILVLGFAPNRMWNTADERGAGFPAPPSQIQVLHLSLPRVPPPQPPSCDPPRLQGETSHPRTRSLILSRRKRVNRKSAVSHKILGSYGQPTTRG